MPWLSGDHYIEDLERYPEAHAVATEGETDDDEEFYESDSASEADDDMLLDSDWASVSLGRQGPSDQSFDAASDDEGDALDGESDVSARQVRRGRDIQGIPWDRLHFTRAKYRSMRLQQYKNYKNLDAPLDRIEKEARRVETGSNFYEFAYNTRAVKSTIIHFQLRNLVWATSKHDVFTLHQHAVSHFSALSRQATEVLDLGGPLVSMHHQQQQEAAAARRRQAALSAGLEPSAGTTGLHTAGLTGGTTGLYTGSLAGSGGGGSGSSSLHSGSSRTSGLSSAAQTAYGTSPLAAAAAAAAGGLPFGGATASAAAAAAAVDDVQWEAVGRVQVSTMCVRAGLVVAGGFQGEMVCKRLGAEGSGVVFTGRVSRDETAITNAVEICEAASGAPRLLASNNDCALREIDVGTFAVLARHSFPWPVNHTSVSPTSSLVVVAGDDPDACLLDATSGRVVAHLQGHVDYSFATAWHPGGNLFATGNQDTTCRVWDRRNMGASLHTLKGRIGAIRSIRFSSDGRFMAMAEPADFVHIFDTCSDFAHAQEIDLFGEIAGISYSPDTEALFIGVADRTYSSLLEFNRARDYGFQDFLI
eukprot:TRINITY_DN16907_c0_g1_i3.p1 TRINITY_DN16907_c0_g1~~TRINITY_DN16907_c0_g1_i3.p1  ORF type:complete len:588 (+),score=-9.10 TRINITY_DN16907_c0_g1_i3:222-1985(+)